VTYLVGGLVLVCVGLTMLAQQQAGRTVLVQQLRAAPRMHTMRQQDLARALMLKGQQLEATAQQEIKLGQQLAASSSNEMNPVAGEMLGAVNCSNTSCVGLEANGVNVDMWPQNWEVTRLPGYKPPEPINESEYNSTLDSIDEDYDFYNRKPLLDAGVNLGSWFWEPEDMDDAPKNESAPPSPEELAADEELEAILKKMENATSPEQRLARAGIKIEGMPWDPEPDYEEDYDDEEDEDDEEEEAAVEKSRPMSLKMRKQMQLKQMRIRQHKLQQLHVAMRGKAMSRKASPLRHPVQKPFAYSRKVAHTGFKKAKTAYQQGLAAYQHYRRDLLKKRLLIKA